MRRKQPMNATAALCGKVALWIVSHFGLMTFQVELDPLKNCATLSKTVAGKEVFAGPHMRTIPRCPVYRVTTMVLFFSPFFLFLFFF